MKVLSVDPGYDRLGLAILEKNNEKELLLHSSCFETDKKTDLKERLFLVGKEIRKKIKEFGPKYLAIEKVYFNKNQKTAMAVSETRGIIIYEALLNGLEVFEFTPQEIKVAVTGYGKSDKKQVIDMTKLLLGIKNKKALDDEFDAIAVGITFFAQHKIKSL